MKKKVELIPLEELRKRAPNISFPEYQREATVWDRRAQQRLIDSIMRGFDISAFYFYETQQGELECVDGRQRLTAILSFTGDMRGSEHDTYVMRIENEIAPDERDDLKHLQGRTFEELSLSRDLQDQQALHRFNEFKITAVILSDSEGPLEFNLQFTRLNLGTIINSGEKLHAMEGDMHDQCFDNIGKHRFLNGVGIPTRRYAQEQVAAQFLCQIYSLVETGEFRRVRHFDLQKFFKEKFHMSAEDQQIAKQVEKLLSKLADLFQENLALLRNRALTVSLVLLAWEQQTNLDSLPEFWKHFTGRLDEQLKKLKELEGVDERYRWLIDFQKDVTQASVEKLAIKRRHDRLKQEFRRFRDDGRIEGDQ